MKTRDQFFQELFNRPPTPEEQHHFDRLGSLMSLAQDDSMWYVILVNEFYDNRLKSRLNDIEAVSNSAAKAALVKIGEAVEEKAEEIAAVKNQGFLWRSWGMMMSMVVLLGAICVNAGYVMGSGKYPFWLAPENTLFERVSKIAGYFLNVPSGWILLLGSSPFLLKSFFESASIIKRNSRLGITEKKGRLVMKAIGSFISLIAIVYITLATF